MNNFYNVYLHASISQRTTVLAASAEDASALAIASLESGLNDDTIDCQLTSINDTLVTLERVPSPPPKAYRSLKDVYAASTEIQETASREDQDNGYTPLVSS